MIILTVICVLLHIVLSSYTGKLKFKSNGKFRIAQFTDLHYGNDSWVNWRTAIVQDDVLNLNSVDFVAYTGDIVQGYDYDGPGFTERQLKDCTSHHHNIPYGITLGNHDIEGDLGGDDIVIVDQQHSYSMTKLSADGVHGSTNYWLPVYDSQDNIKLILWFFDSGSKGCLDDKYSWGCIHPTAVEWYKSQSKEIGNIPGVAFWHIPTEEFMTEFYTHDAYGINNDVVSCPNINTGIISAMKEIGNIKAVFVGHNHNNDYYFSLDGIQLHFGRKTGIGNYGPVGMDEGSKIIEIDLNYNINTWIFTWKLATETQKLIQDKGYPQTQCATPSYLGKNIPQDKPKDRSRYL